MRLQLVIELGTLLMYSDWTTVHGCPVTTSTTMFLPDVVEPETDPRNLSPGQKKEWGGWNPPVGAGKEKKRYLDELKDQEELLERLRQMGLGNKTMIPKEDDFGFPKSWKNLSLGFSGMHQPPPWSYEPMLGSGKPYFCLMPPDPGNCTQKLTRHGFNPFVDMCVPFTYTGCGGNFNNFKTRFDCANLCERGFDSGCDGQNPIYDEE